jgi:hypothetical protein
LMLTAVAQGRLSLERLTELMYSIHGGSST